MVMWVKWYGAEHITQYGRSRATLDATGSHHRASFHLVLPLADAKVIDFGVKN